MIPVLEWDDGVTIRLMDELKENRRPVS